MSYVLLRRLDARKAALGPDDTLYYEFSSSEHISPCIRGSFAGRRGRLPVRVERRGDELSIVAGLQEPGNATTLPEGFADELRVLGFALTGGGLAVRCSLEASEATLIEMASRAKAWDLQPAELA